MGTEREVGGAEAPEPLTDKEREAVRMAGQLYTLIAEHIVADGPTRAADLAEICGRIHDIQYRIEAQAAARAYPGRFRLLGGEVRRLPARPGKGD